MNHYTKTLLAGAALAAAVAVGTVAARAADDPFLSNVNARGFSVTGTIVSVRGGRLVVRIDDHHHNIPFAVGSGVSISGLKAGERVSVRYHPSGETGQVAEAVQLLGRRS